MDRNQIAEQLDEHDKVRSREEVTEWKRGLKGIGLAEKRRKAMEFFNNPNMITNFKRVDDAIQSISNEESAFKTGLKRQIAQEEYKKFGEEPKTNKRNQDVMNPPGNFTTEADYTANEDFSEFKCSKCGEAFNSQQVAIIHIEKELKYEWNKHLEAKLKSDKRFTEWYASPADIKHLTVKNNLPNPEINACDEQSENDDNDNEDGTEGLVKQLEKERQKVRRLSGELSKEKSRKKANKPAGCGYAAQGRGAAGRARPTVVFSLTGLRGLQATSYIFGSAVRY
jgi:hypothetical protein